MLKWSLLVLSASWHCCLKILNNSILELGFSKFNGVIKYAYEQRTQIHYVSLPHLHIVFLVSSEPRILVDPQYVGAEQTPIECKCLWLNGGWNWQPQEIMACVWTRNLFQSRNKAILKKKKKRTTNKPNRILSYSFLSCVSQPFMLQLMTEKERERQGKMIPFLSTPSLFFSKLKAQNISRKCTYQGVK